MDNEAYKSGKKSFPHIQVLFFSCPLVFVHTKNYYVKVYSWSFGFIFFGNGFMFCKLARWFFMEGNLACKYVKKLQYLNGNLYLELSANSGVNYLIMKWSQFQTTLMMQALSILLITLNVTCNSIYSITECLRSINIFS